MLSLPALPGFNKFITYTLQLFLKGPDFTDLFPFAISYFVTPKAAAEDNPFITAVNTDVAFIILQGIKDIGIEHTLYLIPFSAGEKPGSIGHRLQRLRVYKIFINNPVGINKNRVSA